MYHAGEWGHVKAPLGLALLLLLFPGCLEDVFGEKPVEPYDYIRDKDYTSWTIEFDWVEDRPLGSATSLLKDRMSGLVKKDQVGVVVGPAIEAPGQTWSARSIESLSRQTRDHATGGSTVTTHVLYLPGQYEGGNVLGVTIGFDIVAIFPDTIRSACNPLRLCFLDEAEIEGAVLVHEFGHAIGLVDRGIPMVRPHEDADHEHHSSNRGSVMWWQVESAGGLPALENLPTRFDEDDRRDICAAGGRC